MRAPSSSNRARAALAALVLLAAPHAAHDHWIAPASFRPAVGERLEVRLHVGHPSGFQEQVRDPRRIVRFELVAGERMQPLLGLDGRSPAAFLTLRAAGTTWLVYQSNHAFVEIEPTAYARYLEEEGLDDVRAERERRGEEARPGRDSYLRCDKALLQVGDGPLVGHERLLGLPLELALASDPRAGDELVLRLVLEGEPLAGRQVKWMRLAAPHTIELARTDALGQVRFPREPGRHVAASVHQRRARPEQGLEGDWEGLWASLALEL